MEINKLINADCMEVMKDIPNKYFELAIVDPPYGEKCDINSNGNRCATRNGFSDLYLNHTSQKWNKKPSERYFKELFRVSQNQIIWGGNFFQLQATSCMLVWNKMQREFTFGDGEIAWTSFKSSIRIFDYSRGEMQKEKRFHISQKPVALYKWLLKNYAKQGDKILDTHAGSCSSVIACIDMGFEWLAIEKDEDYYRQAQERINKELLKIKIEF